MSIPLLAKLQSVLDQQGHDEAEYNRILSILREVDDFVVLNVVLDSIPEWLRTSMLETIIKVIVRDVDAC